jgi:hypothetical protein
MTFPGCAKCGVVTGIACACVLATVHHQSLCGQFDWGGAYCTKFVAELVHGPHHERPVFPSGPYTVFAAVGSTSSTATWSDSGSFPIIR